MCDALHDLVPFVQFKKREKRPWRSATLLKLKPATLLKLTLFHGCFSRFWNCANATKPRNAPHVPAIFDYDFTFWDILFPLKMVIKVENPSKNKNHTFFERSRATFWLVVIFSNLHRLKLREMLFELELEHCTLKGILSEDLSFFIDTATLSTYMIKWRAILVEWLHLR